MHVGEDAVTSDTVLRIRYSGSIRSPEFERLVYFLAYFHGDMPVEVEFASDGTVKRLDRICDVMTDKRVIEFLGDIVGDDNITFC